MICLPGSFPNLTRSGLVVTGGLVCGCGDIGCNRIDTSANLFYYGEAGGYTNAVYLCDNCAAEVEQTSGPAWDVHRANIDAGRMSWVVSNMNRAEY